MTEEDAIFDPSLKKKKKKKKIPFDISLVPEVEEPTTLQSTESTSKNEKLTEELENDSEDLLKKKKKKKKGGGGGETNEFDESPLEDDDLDLGTFGKKKKKKKSKEPLSMEELEGSLPDVPEGEDYDLESFGKKKKKKKRVGLNVEGAEEDKENKNENETEKAWHDTDRDYTYDELLQRVFVVMKDKNPEVVAGEKRKFVMRPPQVVRVGTKKSAFVNFTEIAKMLHRQPKHLSDFLSAELGTVGTVDGNNQLIMKGRFQQKHIENVLRRYIKEYVTCHTCRSPETILNKEARLFFLQCMTCHSRCSVQSIKTGFQAVTGKRSAIRAKQ